LKPFKVYVTFFLSEADLEILVIKELSGSGFVVERLEVAARTNVVLGTVRGGSKKVIWI
jgi:hypothetical protein